MGWLCWLAVLWFFIFAAAAVIFMKIVLAEVIPKDWSLQRAVDRDLENMLRIMKKKPKRKYSPPWGVPTECWILLLDPSFRYREARAGVGARCGPPSAPAAYTAIRDTLIHIRSRATVPCSWLWSAGHQVPKPGTKLGPRGQRLVHSFDHFCLAFFAAQASRMPPRTSSPWAHGGICHKSRATAMVVQQGGLMGFTWTPFAFHDDHVQAISKAMIRIRDTAQRGDGVSHPGSA